jgi:CHASE2 domain-containing sensor protein
MNKLLLKDALGATVTVFLVYALLGLSILNLGFLDPVHTAIHHVKTEYENLFIDITKGKRSQHPTLADTTIYLVNIDTLDRPSIGRLIRTLSRYNPKVIGLDVVFNERKAKFDTLLLNALEEVAPKLITSTALKYKQDTLLAQQEKGDTVYQIGKEGYTNFVSPSEIDMVRYFLPQLHSDSVMYESFATQVLKLYDSTSYDVFMKHREAAEIFAPEVIVYQRPAQEYRRLQPSEVFDPDNIELGDLKNKIVLIGFLGDSIDLEDKHYSPFNAGGKFPDMNGVAIHANIIEMLLRQDYINYANEWALWIISFVLTFLMMLFFVHQFVKYHLWFHTVFKVVQFLTAALIFGVGLWVFHVWQVKTDTLKIIVPIALSVDVLYFYDTLVKYLHKRFGYETYFDSEHGH